MAKLTNAQLTALVEQLERNAADDLRRIGVMMYEANVASQRINELEAEVESLQDKIDSFESDDDIAAELETAKAVIARQARVIAASPKTAPPAQPKTPAPKPSVPAQVIASPAAQEAMAVFLKLSPLQRSAVVKHSGFKVVNLSNILECQSKWHSRKAA